MLIKTTITLPPGPLTRTQITTALATIIETYKWIKPKKFGSILPDELVNWANNEIAYEQMYQCYKDNTSLQLQEKRSNYMGFFPHHEANGFAGIVYWVTSYKATRFKVAAHNAAIRQLMSLFKSPYAYSAAEEAIEHWSKRWIKMEVGSKEVFNVGNYTKGLENAYWRMWFGKTYTNFFGATNLNTLAQTYTVDTIDDITFTEVHPNPKKWDSEAAVHLAKQFKTILGQDTFYNPQHPEKELKAPNFRHLFSN